ncbi:MAG: hypothetical protein WBW80_04235 [Acidimicrobiales bacterium]
MNTLRRLSVVALVLMPVLIFAGPAAAAKGGNKATVEQCKQSADMGFRNLGQCVSSGAKGVLPELPPRLAILPDIYTVKNDPNCGGPGESCWGTVDGVSLKPTSLVTLTEVQNNGQNVTSTLHVESDGIVDLQLRLACGDNAPDGITSVQASGTTASDVDINTPVVSKPC